VELNIHPYIGFKTLFYVVRHLDSTEQLAEIFRLSSSHLWLFAARCNTIHWTVLTYT